MKDAMVQLNPEAGATVVRATCREAMPKTAGRVAHTPVRPAKHWCEEQGSQDLAHRVPALDCSAQAAEQKSSISSLFAELHRTGTSLWFEKAPVVALVVAAAISIGASLVAGAKLLNGWAAFERLVERIVL
jgi:hypothetical protein